MSWRERPITEKQLYAIVDLAWRCGCYCPGYHTNPEIKKQFCDNIRELAPTAGEASNLMAIMRNAVIHGRHLGPEYKKKLLKEINYE